MATILVVDDRPANLELMTYLLNKSGHTTLVANTGEKGLQTALQELPELIICDVQMPGMDGYEVAQQVRRNTALRNIPLVAVTAFAMGGDREKVLAAGFDGYLAKPINPRTFVQEVETFLHAGSRSTTKSGEDPP